MEKYRCKLCLKKFGNGRALGGHMRSHMMNLHVTSKRDDHEQKSEDFLQVFSSPSLEKEEKDEENGKNGKERGRLVDLECSVVLQDRESETESSKEQQNCRRSKRVRKSRISDTNQTTFDQFLNIRKANESSSSFVEAEPVSSISETSPEEDVAYCLMMLSRDKWVIDEDVDEDDDYHDNNNGDDDVNEDDFGVVKVKKARSRGKYKCESCNKVFRSYQALGGHRASHKKMRISLNNEIATTTTTRTSRTTTQETSEMVMKIHECPVCYRVFSSGQALGGHKRSHGTIAIANANSNASVVNVVAKPISRIIDLNLPAPLDDDDDDDANDDHEISQMEVSAVSD